MLEVIQRLDELIVVTLNSSGSAFWDSVMWWISGKTTWWPFYLVLLSFIFWKKGWKKGGVAFLLTILLITVSDQTSVHLFKEVFQRPRPSHNPEIENMLNYVRNYRGGTYGFISSHASNSFAVAGFLSLVFRLKWFTIVILLWASLVSYSRIYLGVHYITDILAGVVWGIFLSLLFYRLYRKVEKSSLFFPGQGNP